MKGKRTQINYEVRAHALRLMRSGNYTAKEIVKNTVVNFPEVHSSEVKKQISELCASMKI